MKEGVSWPTFSEMEKLVFLFLLGFSIFVKADELIDIDRLLYERWEKVAAPPGIQKFMEIRAKESFDHCTKEHELADRDKNDRVDAAYVAAVTRFSAVPINVGRQNERVFLVVSPVTCFGWLWGSAHIYWFIRVTNKGKLQEILFAPHHRIRLHDKRTNGYRDVTGYYGDNSCRYRFDGKEYNRDESIAQWCNPDR
ncbi:MAG: hypothetical protein Q8L93_00355 [Rhodocyclaceae bacterium]|nr:hypothetical protein [Rhodocyclaceae bacterium]